MKNTLNPITSLHREMPCTWQASVRFINTSGLGYKNQGVFVQIIDVKNKPYKNLKIERLEVFLFYTLIATRVCQRKINWQTGGTEDENTGENGSVKFR